MCRLHNQFICPIVSVIVNLHVACNMPSLLDIYFFAKQIHFLRNIGNCVMQLNPCLMKNILDLMINILSPIMSS
jgi:hypothetical protein